VRENYSERELDQETPVTSPEVHMDLFGETHQNEEAAGTSMNIGEKWCAQGDDFRTFPSEFVANLPNIEVPAELGL
jgi:hypothetical protein